MSTADERPIAGPVPRWEIPGWRERFGVHAGITGRGDDAAPFDLGLWSEQPVGAVMTRWHALLQTMPDCPRAVMARQVHGDRVLWHQAGEPGWLIADGADGHVTARPGTLLLITVADCIPVYLIAPKRRAIALLHAGWRGTAAGILARGVDAMVRQCVAATDEIVMHCGVGICGPCYQVGHEVAAGLGRPSGPGPSHVDLRSVLSDQARTLGIGEISTSAHCSAHATGDFFSHRRSAGRDGRMVAYLGLPRTG